MTLKNFLPIFLAIVLAMLLSGCPGGIILPTPTDWGDAPDKPYPTVEADNGARHTIVEKFHLARIIHDMLIYVTVCFC